MFSERIDIRTIRIKGQVFSGFGEGARFTELSWFKEQVMSKLGFVPHPGTLNLKLDEEGKRARTILEKAKSVVIVPKEGFCHGKCFKARVMDSVDGAIVIPEVKSYPDDMLEVIAPISLREKFRLRDGDTVVLDILLE
ncbi:MAG: DUF120 domain-containing protein [Candidatus Bathyarchaeia archaeon]